MYAVVIEKLVSSWLHQEIYGNVFATILQPLYLLVGSLVLAYLLARTCTFFYRRLNMQDEHSFVALFGLVLLAIAVAHLFKLSTILALLAAGIIVKNHEARPQLWPQHFGTAGWLLTVILFVLTLTSFEWKDIALGGVAALGLIVARLVAKLVGVLAFAKPSGLNWKQGMALGLSLSPMSALAYLLVDDTYNSVSELRPAIARHRDVFDFRAADSRAVARLSQPRAGRPSGAKSKRGQSAPLARGSCLHALFSLYSIQKNGRACDSRPADLTQGTPCHSNPSSIRNRSHSVSNSKCRSSIRTTMI